MDTAYRVLDDYLKKGREAAGKQNGSDPQDPLPFPFIGSAGAGSVPPRIIKAWLELLGAWFELVTPFAAPKGPSSAEPSGAQAGTSVEPDASWTVSFEAQARRPTAVSVDVTPKSELEELIVQPLQCINGDAPPIANLALEMTPAEHRLNVRVTVADDQPSGIYVGTVFVKETGEPRGSVRVKVEE